MPQQKLVKILGRKEIDDTQWNNTIHNAPNGLIYATTAFLDALPHRWMGMVYNNYEAVFPIVWNKKFGVHYIHQVYYAKCLGVFGNNLTHEIIEQLLQAIPNKFKYWDFDLNEGNICYQPLQQSKVKIKMRKNYWLPLTGSYADICNNYSTLCKRKLNLAQKHFFSIAPSENIQQAIDFYKLHYAKTDALPAYAFDFLHRISTRFFQLKKASLYFAVDAGQELIAMLLIFFDDKNIYLALGGSNADGKQAGAYYALIDFALKNHAATAKTFRFEGSDKEGIAFFNRQFGAIEMPYPHLNKNILPFPFRWLKK